MSKRSSKRYYTKYSTPRSGTSKKTPLKKQQPRKPARSGGSDGVSWKSSALSRNVIEILIPLTRAAEWEQWVLLSADRHWDNPKSSRELQTAHLDEAKERKAIVIDIGDLFCLMQGKYDKRASKSGVRPEHQRDDYIDAVIQDAARFFAPYGRNMVLCAVGNHESAITKRLEVNPTDRFVGLLNMLSGGATINGGFSGWVRFGFTCIVNSKPSTFRSVALHYDHGYAGGGQVTQDAIQHQRRSVYLPDADIVVSGHTHDSWVKEISRVRLTPTGNLVSDIQTHIKLPTYKDEYEDGFAGWHVETGKPPKPLGAYWIRFYWHRPTSDVRYTVIKAG